MIATSEVKAGHSRLLLVLVAVWSAVLAIGAPSDVEREYAEMRRLRATQIATVDGDLNQDGLSDLVIAAQPDDSTRVLAIYLRGVTGVYQCYGRYEQLLPPPDPEGNVDDEITLEVNKRGSLVVRLHRFASMGSWSVDNTADVFRFKGDDFYLVGTERNSLMRNTGEVTCVSTNYLTGKQLRVTYNEFDRSVPRRERWSVIGKGQLRHIGNCSVGSWYGDD